MGPLRHGRHLYSVLNTLGGYKWQNKYKNVAFKISNNKSLTFFKNCKRFTRFN